MSLHPNAGSENSLVWQAMDASDGDPQPEQLAVRFKLAETTQRFKTVFEECQAELRKAAEKGETPRYLIHVFTFMSMSAMQFVSLIRPFCFRKKRKPC